MYVEVGARVSVYKITSFIIEHVHPSRLQSPLRDTPHYGGRLPQHKDRLRRQRTARRGGALRKLKPTQYVQVNKTTGEKVEMDFYNSFARENSDPESILENCFIDDWEGFQTLTGSTLAKKLLVNPSEHPLFYI